MNQANLSAPSNKNSSMGNIARSCAIDIYFAFLSQMETRYLSRPAYFVEERNGALRIREPRRRAKEPVWLGIPLSRCNEGCGGYRFQPFNYGKCRGRHSCCYKARLTREELKREACRYIHECPVCHRLFVGSGGRSDAKVENAACPDDKCRLAWAQANPCDAAHPQGCEGNTCAVCRKICFTKFAVTTLALPSRHGDRVTFGAEFCLCPGACLKAFREESRADLKIQARALIERGVAKDIEEDLRQRTGV